MRLQSNGEAAFQAPAKISECDLEEIKKPLRRALILCGVRAQNFPKDAEKLLLIDFLRKHYPSYTPAELAFAFELAMARKLDIDNPDCFENFSCSYIGKILSAYEEWDSSTVQDRRLKYMNLRNWDLDRGETETWYQKYLEGQFIHFIPQSVYHVLLVDGQIKAIPPSEGRRAFPKFLKVLRYFEHCRSEGYSHIYTRQEGNRGELPEKGSD